MNRKVSGSTGIGTRNIRDDYNSNCNSFQGTIIKRHWRILRLIRVLNIRIHECEVVFKGVEV
jgi:hypothetical protein